MALQILKDNRELLAETAGQLLKDEVIEGEDLIILAEAVKSVSDTRRVDESQSDTADMAA
jgi:hypothetical protein